MVQIRIKINKKFKDNRKKIIYPFISLITKTINLISKNIVNFTQNVIIIYLYTWFFIYIFDRIFVLNFFSISDYLFLTDIAY